MGFEYERKKIKKSALVMCLADPSGSPRPRRIVGLLMGKGFEVDVVGFPSKQDFGPCRQLVVSVPRPGTGGYAFGLVRDRLLKLARLLFRKGSVRDWFNDVLYRVRHLEGPLTQKDYDLLIVEDLFLLPLAFRIKRLGAVIFDAREYYPRQNEESWLWRAIEGPERTRLCWEYLARCDRVITVSSGLAAEYKRVFGVAPEVVMSAPRYEKREVRRTDAKRIRLVHHGLAKPNRQLEKMIEVVKRLDDRFILDLYLTGSEGNVRKIRRVVAGEKRVRLLDPVPFTEITEMLSGYDIGFYYLEPKGFNVTYNLPNKLFEFIQARLAVAIGPSLEMAGLVQHHGCGVVAKEFSVRSMAEVLNALTPEVIDEFKRKSSQAAETLSFEEESGKVLKIIGEISGTEG